MAGQVSLAREVHTRALLPRQAWAALLGALVCALALWGYVGWVLIPYQVGEAAASGRPRGNLSDLYPRWLGSREMLLSGADPYSPEVTRQIQLGYYGVVLDPENPIHPRDQQGFAYPVYVAFLLAPFVLLPFDVVQEGFGWLLLAVTALSVPLWMAALRSRLSPATAGVVTLLVLGSFPVVQGHALQQLTMLATFMLAAAMALLARGHYAAAGVLMAVATIKPQLAAPLMIGLFIWSIHRLRARQGFLWGFGGTMLLLLLGAELALPGWIPKFVAALGEYQRYTSGISLLSTFFGNTAGAVLSLLAIAVTLVFWNTAGREAQPGERFGEALALTLVVTLLVIPTWAPYNQVLLLPALLILLRQARRAWNAGGRLTRYAYLFAAGAIAWPWIAAIVLVVAAGAAALAGGGALDQVRAAWAFPLATALFVPPAVLLALLLTLRLPRQAE